MKYTEDFEFYLLPSNAIFAEFLSQFKSNEDIPRLTRKDFEQIVDIALQNNIITEGNIYKVKEELRQVIPSEKKIKNTIFEKKSTDDVVSKLDPIYNSHMGVSLLFELYYFDYLCLLKDKGTKLNNRSITDQELSGQRGKIKSIIELNNSPVNESKPKMKVRQ